MVVDGKFFKDMKKWSCSTFRPWLYENAVNRRRVV